MKTTRTAWQLNFRFSDLQRITLTLPGEDHPTVFWYLLYEVTNDSGHDVEFYPSFRLVTDTLEVTVGGANVSPGVYDAIAARHHKAYPFFAVPTKITGPLLQGEENSRASAAVFRAFDPRASRFTIYVSGLSGELARVADPSAGTGQAPPGQRLPRSFILRRTLAITYDLPGDPGTRQQARPIRRSREWVMR